MPIIFGEQVVTIEPREIDFSYFGLGLQNEPEVIDLGSSEYVSFGLPFLGAFQAQRDIAFVTAPSATELTNTLPPAADPPFPPVWPYPFVGGLLYGREHLGMNLRMTREDDFEFSGIVIDEAGDPYDLTGCSLELMAKWNVRDIDASAIFTCTSSPANGITIAADPTTGGYTVLIASAKTSGCPMHRVFLNYQMRLNTAASALKTVGQGVLRVDLNIINPVVP